MWGYLRLRWGLSETSKNTTPPRAPNGTKKANKKVCVEIHSWKMVWQNCPVSWKFWFPEVISLTMGYCSIQITPYNCTWKPFWVAKPKPQNCSASAFPYFEAEEIGVIPLNWLKLGKINVFSHMLDQKNTKTTSTSLRGQLGVFKASVLGDQLFMVDL